MTEPQHLDNRGALGELGELAMRNPTAFNILSETMGFLPDIDPEVAYGALHGVRLWCELDLTETQENTLITLASNDPYILYLLLRAQSFKLWSRDQLLDLALSDQPAHNAYEFMKSFLPDWGGSVMEARVKSYGTERYSSEVQLLTK